jgi:DNA end-binding protein Ku
MPRAIWSGTITFGLIAIPVKLYSAIGREDKVDLHLLHEKDGERIHYERRCEKGHKVDWDDIVRGYEYAKGKWVTFTDEELDAIRTESMHTVDVVQFVSSDEIDPMYYENTYYVAPDETGAKAYRLLVDALESEGLVGVSKVAIRDRERLAAIRVTDGEIVLNTMRWPDEIRDRSYKRPSGRVTLRDNERKMARQLVRQLAGEFTPDEFEDEYHKALKAAVQRKVKGKDIVVPEGREEPAAVADLMDALKRSVEAVRAGKDPRELRRTSEEDLEQLSKGDLNELAAKLEVEGRSSMTKKDLIRAIKRARSKAA